MNLVTFRFRQSQAVDFYWNLELAKRGSLREFKVHPNITIYESTFDLLNPIQVRHALSLAKALVLDKRAEVFSGNTSLTMVMSVMCCSAISNRCRSTTIMLIVGSRSGSHLT